MSRCPRCWRAASMPNWAAINEPLSLRSRADGFLVAHALRAQPIVQVPPCSITPIVIIGGVWRARALALPASRRRDELTHVPHSRTRCEQGPEKQVKRDVRLGRLQFRHP